MSTIQTLTRASRLDNGTTITSVEDISSDGSVTLDVTIPASTTNQAHALAINPAKLRSLFMLSSQAVTVKTNSTGAPNNTYNLVAGVALEWSADAAYFTNPVGTTITIIYVTNSGTTAARLRIRAGVNS